jgi:hypothetical protein
MTVAPRRGRPSQYTVTGSQPAIERRDDYIER